MGKEIETFGEGVFTEFRDHEGFIFQEGLKIRLRGGGGMGKG